MCFVRMKEPHKAIAEIQPWKVSAGERKINKSLIWRERMLFKWGLVKQITFYMYKFFCLNFLSTSETPQLLAPSSSPSFVSEHINSGVSKSICCAPSPHTVLCNTLQRHKESWVSLVFEELLNIFTLRMAQHCSLKTPVCTLDCWNQKLTWFS